MSDIDVKRVMKPKWFSFGPLKRGRFNRDTYVIGFDSEAEGGKPFLYQFAHPDGHVDLLDVGRGRYESLRIFVDYLWRTCTRSNVEYVVFGFNLQYEYTQLFRHCGDAVYASEFVLDASNGAWQIRALNDKRYTFVIEWMKQKRQIRVVDAMAFLPMSLDAASKLVHTGAKLAKPTEFSRKASHTPKFIAYAKQDAILTQKLGEHIVEWHRNADINQTISAPMLAARVFRRKYLKTTLPDLTPDLEQYGLYSYHGGKNGYYANKPQLLKEVYNYDIRSAYPEAMAQLPCIEHGEWSFHDGYKAGTHSIYHVDLAYRPCRYHPAYHLGGTRVTDSGRVGLWITGYELDSMVEKREVTLYQCARWEFTTSCDCGKRTPLAAYVADFYALKRDAQIEAERVFAKLNLNSLYGKFFQKQPIGNVGVFDIETEQYVAHDPSEPYDYRAGGLYHPPFASLITGFVRAKIHRLEHKYQSIMTSTDGFFATIPPDPSDIGRELGQLDVSKGELRIWRERLYIFTPSDDGKLKYALHGFRGGIAALRRVPLSLRAFTYQATEMVTLKRARMLIEGKRYEAGAFVQRTFTLQPLDNGP